MMQRLVVGLIVWVFSCAAATPALAQQGVGEIRGRVLDEQGGVLPGVALVATNQDTGVFRDVTSNPDGSYFVSQLTPGTYRVTAALSGFSRFERRDLVVGVGRTVTVDITLQIGAIEETVTVTSVTPLVDVTSAEVGGNLGSEEISQLPSIGRNFVSFIALVPGIQAQATAGSFGCDSIISAGGASKNNNMAMDGAGNMDDYLGSSCGAQARTALESIQEFQVLTNQFDAEFGRTGGAIVNAITKQGTNQLHGAVFLFDTRSAMTARNFFAEAANLEKPDSTKQEWGGVIGGPIVRDKAHFFFSLERVHGMDGWAHFFPSRPDRSWTGSMDTQAWNTVIRGDQQINANNTWGIRWVREVSPQYGIQTDVDTPDTLRTQLDWDNTTVGTYTRVLGNNKVYLARVGFTSENNNNGSPQFHVKNPMDLTGLEPSFEGAGTDIRALKPTLIHPSFNAQQEELAYGWFDKGYQLDNVFSWFVADKAGEHDMKFGLQYYRTDLNIHTRTFMGGAFYFNTDQDFNAANPSTYPERLRIRVPGPQLTNMSSQTGVLFVQDKWRVNPRLTLSAGVRYDLESIPLDLSDSPLALGSTDYPVDKTNVSPRLSVSYNPGGRGTSVLRGGYGKFYEKTYQTLLDELIVAGKWSDSFELYFPANAADPGPSRGQLPTDPFLVNGPLVNWALLDARYPRGTLARNDGTVYYGTPDRKNASSYQITAGYERQIASQMSFSADYVHSESRDAFLMKDLNPRLRADTSRTSAAPRFDAFGLLREPYRGSVYLLENAGSTKYDGLNVMLEKRMSEFWSARVAYSLSYARGNYTGDSGETNPMQVLDQLNLDKNEQPLGNDRTHNLALSGRVVIPKTGGVTLSGVFHYMSGLPLTIFSSDIDANRNGILLDPLPAGTYSGTGLAAMTVENNGGLGGARGPDYIQTDLRIGYRPGIVGQGRTLDLFVDIQNVTNRVNFNNPSGDARLSATFLRPTGLRGRSGFPRQGQLGVRFGF